MRATAKDDTELSTVLTDAKKLADRAIISVAISTEQMSFKTNHPTSPYVPYFKTFLNKVFNDHSAFSVTVARFPIFMYTSLYRIALSYPNQSDIKKERAPFLM